MKRPGWITDSSKVNRIHWLLVTLLSCLWTDTCIVIMAILWSGQIFSALGAWSSKVGYNEMITLFYVISYCCWSVTQSCPTFCDSMDCSMTGLPFLHHLLECAQTYVHWVGDVIQPSHLLSPPSPPALNLSQHQGFFSSESALHIRWPKYWNFIFSISPSNEKSGLISFMIDGFDLLDVPGTLRSLLQHLSLKVSILQISPSLCSKSHIHTWLLEKP